MRAVVGLALLLAQGAIFGQQFTPFNKVQTIDIPGSGTEGPASPFPSTVTVSGLPGEVKRVQVSIHNFTHTNPDDVDAMLVYERPEIKNADGVVVQTKRTRGFLFWSDAGGPHDVSKIDLTFDDKASGSLPDDTILSGGTFKPTNHNTQPGDVDNFGFEPDEMVLPIGGLDDIVNFVVDGKGRDGNGTWKLYINDDQIVDSGNIAGGWTLRIQSQPVISSIDNQTIDEDKTKAINFTVNDNGGSDALTLKATSSNTTLLPDNRITISGSGNNRVIEVSPSPDRNGITTVTITAADGPVNSDGSPSGNTQTVEREFTLTVTPKNDAPTITQIGNQTTEKGKAIGPFEIEINDGGAANNETLRGDLAVVVTSLNAAVVDPSDVFIYTNEDDLKRKVLIAPKGAATGSANIKIKVTDNAADGGGGDNKSAETNFTVTVTDNIPKNPAFASTSAITDNGTAILNINTGRGSKAGKVKVVIANLSVENPENLVLTLRAPNNSESTLMAASGGANALDRVRVTFDDAARLPDGDDAGDDPDPKPLPNSTLIPNNDTFQPSNGGVVAGDPLSGLIGSPLDGDWGLIVTGLQHGDSIGDGFVLIIEEGPVISEVSLGANGRAVTNEDTPLDVSFIIADTDTNVADLKTSATAIANAGRIDKLETFGTGSNRTLRITPAPNAHGPAKIELKVEDKTAGSAGTIEFFVDIIPVNDVPTISFIDKQTTTDGKETSKIAFTVNDIDSPNELLTVIASSSNDKIVPVDQSHILLFKNGILESNAGEAPKLVNATRADNLEIQLVPVPQANKSNVSTDITITVEDAQGGRSSRTFQLTVLPAESAIRVSNALVTIRDNNTANPTPSPIIVSGLQGNIREVSVTLIGLTHEFPSNVDVLLVGPDGTGVMLMSGVGGDLNLKNTQLTFEHDAGSSLPAPNTFIPSGTYLPTVLNGRTSPKVTSNNQPVTPAGIPTGPFGTDLSVFTDKSPIGTWNLYITDSVASNSGTLAGWSINIITQPNIGGLPNELTMLEGNERKLDFTIGDVQGAAGQFDVQATSNNVGLIPNAVANISITGSGANRTLTIKPAANANSGSDLNNLNKATITVTVSNGVTTDTHNIVVTVTPVNSPPTIEFVDDSDNGPGKKGVTTPAGIPTSTIPFTINDVETPGDLQVTASSSDTAIIPNTNIHLGGSGANRTVQVVPNGALVGRVTITLTVAEKSGEKLTNTINFVLTVDGAANSAFESTSGITIRDNTTANPYPSTIPVNNLVGTVSKVQVVLEGFAHQFPEDVDILLMGPNGRSALLMSDVGGNATIREISAKRLTFDGGKDDEGNYFFPNLDGNPIVTGTYRPSNIGEGDTFPSGPSSNIFSGSDALEKAFNGSSPNGEWKLFVVDDTAPDSGSISRWLLILQTGPTLSVSDLSPTGFRVDPNNNNNQTKYDGLKTKEDTSVDVGFTVGDSDTNLDNLTITVKAQNRDSNGTLTDTIDTVTDTVTGSDLVNVRWKKGKDSNNNTIFVDKDGKAVAVADLPTKGIREDLIISGTGSKRTLTIRPSTHKNTDGSINNIDPENDVQETVITVEVSDGTSTTTKQFILEVNRVNDIPALSFTNLTDGKREVNEDNVATVNFSFSDIETINNSDITFSAKSGNTDILRDSGDNNGIAIARDNNAGTGTLTLTPRANANGTVTVTLTATDKHGGIQSRSFPLEVKPVNDAPIIGRKDGNGNIVNGSINNAGTKVATPVEIEFSVGDIETDPKNLVITASAPGNEDLLPSSSFVLSGTGVDRTMTITPVGQRTGDNVEVLFTVKDADNGTASARFTLTVSTGDGQTFHENGRIVFFDNAAASPYPSTLNVPPNAVIGAVRDVKVTLNKLKHSTPDDIDILLVAPGGRTVVIMSDAGGSNAINGAGVDITFSDSAAETLPDSGQITFKTYKPSNFDGLNDFFPLPAPAPGNDGYGQTMSVFDGIDPTGNWQLFIRDDTSNGTVGAEIVEGWSLTILTAPTFVTVPGNQTIDEDVEHTVNITVNNQNSAPAEVELSATSNNQALIPNNRIRIPNFDGAAREIILQSATNANSGGNLSNKATITVTATDRITKETETISFVVTVNPVNDPPVVSGLPRNPVQLNEEEKTTIPFTVADVEDGSDIAVTAVSSDNDLIEINNATDLGGSGNERTINIRPKSNRFGQATITVTATDKNNEPGSGKFTVIVSQVNDPPTIVAEKTDLSTGSGEPVQVKFTVDDREENPTALTVTAVSGNTAIVRSSANGGLVVGALAATDDGKAEGTLTINPVPEQDGKVTITLEVSDGVNPKVTTQVLLTVRPSTNRIFENTSPITIRDNTTADPYPSPIVVSGLKGNLAKLSVTLNKVNHTFPGDIDVLLESPDGKTLILMSDVGSSGRLTDTTLTFSDAAAANLPGNAQINTGTFKPTDNDSQPGDLDNFPAPAPTATPGDELADFNGIDPNGTWSLYIVDDAGGDSGIVSEGWSLSIQTGPTISPIAGQTMDEDTVSKVTFTVSDLDTAAGALQVSAVSSNQNIVPNANLVVTNDGGNASISITPAPNANGTVNITVTVKDQDEHESTATFSLVINPVNDNPVISAIADQSTPTGVDKPVSFTISDAETASNSLVITRSSSNQSLVPDSNIAVSNNSGAVTLTITPAPGANGTTVITVQVADPDGGSDKRSFVLSVIPATDLVFSNTDGIIINDLSTATPYPSVISVANRLGVINNVAVTLEGLTHNFTSDIDALLVGPDGSTATILMSDVGGTSPANNLTITLDNAAANSLPVNSALSSGTFKPTDGESSQGTSENLFPSPAPPSPYPVNLSVFNGMDPNGTWSLYITDDTGIDSGSITSWKLIITTLAPVISNIGDVTTEEDTSVTVDFQISSGDVSSVSATSSDQALIPNSNLVFSGDGGNRTLTITPAANAFGTSEITLSISDGPKGDPQTQIITETFTVTVTPVNDAPVISAIEPQTTPENTSITIPFTVVDPDNTVGNGLEITAVSITPELVPDTGISISPSLLVVTPAPNANGTAIIRIEASDGEFTIRRTFDLIITPVNDAPSISAIGPQTTPEGTAVSIPFTVSDPDNAFSELEITAISITPELVPDGGLVIGGSDGNLTLTVTPVAQASGTAVLRIQASDGVSTTRRTFDLVITPVDDPPGIAPIAVQTVEQGQTLTLSVTVTDPDSPASSLVASVLTLDPNLVPESNLTVTGPTADPNDSTMFVYEIGVTPVDGVSGTAFIRFQIQDGTNTVRRTIEVVVTPPSRTDIVSSDASLSEPPQNPGTGLNGRYWQRKPASITGLANDGLNIIRKTPPTATFIATDINYTGNDLTPVSEWLGADAASLSNPNPGNLDDGLFHITGFISIAQPGEWQFRSESDDGSIVWIGGKKIIDNDGSHGAPGDNPDGTAFFNEPGLYPIEIAYYNGEWTDEAGNHGGASILLTGGPAVQGQNMGSIGSLFYGSQDLEGLASAPSSGIKEATADEGTGLSARYWKLPPASIDRIGGGVGDKTISNVLPDGYFTATSINYTGNDLTPVLDWVGPDAASFRGLESNLDDGLFSFNGFIRIDEPGTVTFSTPSDDGSVVTIGGVKVIDNDGSHGSPGDNPDGKIFFGTPGLYPIEIAYYNGEWTNDAGEHGGAEINFTSDGGGGIGNADATVPTAVLYPAENSFSLANQDIGVEGDPVVPGTADIRNPYPDVYDVDVVAGGSDIWGTGDRGHFVYTEWTGDFDAAVEVTRLDVINQWSKAGISVRETLDPGSRQMYVNVDSAAEPPKDNPEGSGANTYEMGVRTATDGGTSNWDENGGTPRMNVADSTLPAWIRVTRSGDKFTAYRSGNGTDWLEMGSIVQDYPDAVILALGTTSHNNGGEEFVTTAHYRNFTVIPASPEIEAPVVELSFADGAVTITWEAGKLQSASSVSGPWSDVTVIPGRGQPAVPAESPYTSSAIRPAEFYRVVIE